MGTCPDCEENFDLDDAADVGDIVQCPVCKARLEILDLDPAVLDFAVDLDEADKDEG